MLRPPATLRVAMRAGKAMQAGTVLVLDLTQTGYLLYYFQVTVREAVF